MKIIKNEVFNWTYGKGYGLLSFAKNMGKSLNNKCGQKILDSAKKSTADAIKITSKRAIQKTAEATVHLIGNKIAGKITSVSKKSTNKLPNDETEADRSSPKDVPKKDTYLQKKDNKLLMN